MTTPIKEHMGITVTERFSEILPRLKLAKVELHVSENTLALIRGIASGEIRLVRVQR